MSDDALYVLGAVVTIVALRARAPWTRTGGGVLAASLALVFLVAILRGGGPPVQRADQVAALLFLAPAAWLCWRALHRRLHVQVRERDRALSRDPSGTMELPAAKSLAESSAESSAESAHDDPTAGDRPQSTSTLTPFAPAVLALVAVALAAALPAGRATWPPWPLHGLDWLAARVGQGLAEIALPILVVVALLAAPLFDTRSADAPSESGLRRDEVPFFVLAFVLLGALPLALSLFGGQTPPPTVASLSERFWNDLLDAPAPAPWAAREAPGILLLLALFVGLPLWLPRWRATRGAFERHLKRLGPARYALLLTLVVALLYVPLRIALGWALGIGPLVDLPASGVAL